MPLVLQNGRHHTLYSSLFTLEILHIRAAKVAQRARDSNFTIIAAGGGQNVCDILSRRIVGHAPVNQPTQHGLLDSKRRAEDPTKFPLTFSSIQHSATTLKRLVLEIISWTWERAAGVSISQPVEITCTRPPRSKYFVQRRISAIACPFTLFNPVGAGPIVFNRGFEDPFEFAPVTRRCRDPSICLPNRSERPMDYIGSPS